jgi:alpha-galactosidase
MRVEWSVLLYKRHDAVEMRLAFENRGDRPTDMLRDVKVIRHKVTAAPVYLVHESGGYGNWQLHSEDLKGLPGNFEPAVTRFASAGDKLKLHALDGWSSNRDLPLWMVVAPDGSGLYYAFGWTGQWVANMNCGDDGRLSIQAGMEFLNLRLEPGEKISQPSVLLGRFTGGRWVGHNALRRIIYEQYTPKLGGRKPLPPASVNHYYVLGNGIDEKSGVELVDSYAGLGFDYFCIDAGWYYVDFWQSGDWRPQPSRFPNGLEPVARAAKSKGMAMGLWFDPERVTEACYDAFPHKEFLRKATTGPVSTEMGIKVWLLDLSRKDARQWIIDMIGDYARRLDLGWMKWDMNYPPLELWRMADKRSPEREGMMEIRYVEGIYEILDALIKNHPNLCIEWCAGGGRRIDLETLRRCHTIWKSDISGDGPVTRPHLTGANLFLPGNYLNSLLVKLDSSYDYYCQFGGPLGVGHDFRKAKPEEQALARRMTAEFKELRRFLVEDYYPLFDYSADPKSWDGWQFHDPKRDEGFFLVFRPEKSEQKSAIVRLRGLNSKRNYTLDVDSESGLPRTASGGELANGLNVTLEADRSALPVRYRVGGGLVVKGETL